MMTLDEMKLAVCEKLPDFIDTLHGKPRWIGCQETDGRNWDIHWPTEGLQVCHEAEKLLTDLEWESYCRILEHLCRKDLDNLLPGWRKLSPSRVIDACLIHATYEQRLEALCRVWWPERFK